MTTPSPYPPPPWQLVGTSVQALKLVPTDLAASLIPARLRVVPVAPGRTLGALLCAKYDAGSTLRYHELAVAPALTRVGYRLGFWISHLYVDSATSLLGGREIWRLPKQLAEFRWRERGVDVSDGSNLLCRIRWASHRPAIPAPVFAPVLSWADRRFYAFSLAGYATLKRSEGSVEVGATAPFSLLGFQSSRWLVEAKLHARASVPVVADTS
jgi:acetoacetate decarboxylase